jgi:hypothetical protein
MKSLVKLCGIIEDEEWTGVQGSAHTMFKILLQKWTKGTEEQQDN